MSRTVWLILALVYLADLLPKEGNKSPFERQLLHGYQGNDTVMYIDVFTS